MEEATAAYHAQMARHWEEYRAEYAQIDAITQVLLACCGVGSASGFSPAASAAFC